MQYVQNYNLFNYKMSLAEGNYFIYMPVDSQLTDIFKLVENTGFKFMTYSG